MQYHYLTVVYVFILLLGYRRRNMVKEEREELETIKPDSKETDV